MLRWDETRKIETLRELILRKKNPKSSQRK
jgi:hypothetical protein